MQEVPFNKLVDKPRGNEIASHLQCFERLPEIDSPETFGLPKSADISKQKFAAKQLIDDLRALKSGKAEELEFDKDVWKRGLTNIIKLWKSQFKDLSEISANFKPSEKDMAVEDPIESFLFSSLVQGHKNLKFIGDQIKSLVKVIKGEIPLSTELKQLGLDLLLSKTPIEWDKLWEGPTIVLDWLKQYFRKMMAMHRWLDKSQNKGLLNTVLSLSDLIGPEVFLNAHRMIVAAESKNPMEQLELQLTFERPKTDFTFLTIGGIMIQGCSVNGGQICDLDHNDKSEFTKIPTCYISYTHVEATKDKDDFRQLNIPLYSSFSREQLISYFRIPIQGEKSSKIISGVAMAINS